MVYERVEVGAGSHFLDRRDRDVVQSVSGIMHAGILTLSNRLRAWVQIQDQTRVC